MKLYQKLFSNNSKIVVDKIFLKGKLAIFIIPIQTILIFKTVLPQNRKIKIIIIIEQNQYVKLHQKVI